RFTTTAMYAERGSTTQVAGYPLNSGTQVANKVYLDKDSYYNPYGNQVAGAGLGQDLWWARRTIEVPRDTHNQNRTIHIDAALDGEFNLGNKVFSWALGVNHNKVIGTTDNTGNLNLVTLKKALGPSFLNASGVVQCGTPTSPISLSECTPFDILGGPSASTPEAFKYVMADGHATYGSTVNSVTADFTGEIIELPAGMLGFAAGIEKREVSGFDRPNAMDQMALTSSLAGNSTFGAYDVKEAYVEVQIPVLKGMPFAELLSFNVASRYSDYSSFGDTTNSKISFMWKPIKDLLVRGTFAEGFRAPTLGDTFGGGSQTFDSYLDPCDSLHGSRVTNPAVATACAAAGVPANFRQRNQNNVVVTSTGGQTPFPFQSGSGNQFLTPETAETRTMGLVYNPSYVPGLSVGLDWFDIRVDNRITAVSAGYVLGQCYVNGVQSFCSAIKRDPVTGQVVDLKRGNANLGMMSTEGIDLAINYRMPATAWGRFGLRSETTYLDSFLTKSSATATAIENAGPYPLYRVKSNLNLDWSLANWSASWGTRFTSSTKASCYSVAQKIECSNPTSTWYTNSIGYNRLGSVSYHDVSVGYAFPWKGRLMAGVNNVFNKKPRINYDASASASSVDGDVPLEQYFYVRYNQAF
ncbi:MAG TPA: TonB-dependent receptor, partial [Telluria sp.]|nr:TonB-dependent receptor [Telluria sp.]